MKRKILLPLLLCVLTLLSACVFPVQRVSPDPTLPVREPAAEQEASEAEPWQAPAGSKPSRCRSPESMPEEEDRAGILTEAPKLALFWYAMADAGVFELREAFRPVLDASGIPWREYDAENDRWRQADQLRDAVAGGWNILAVQLTDSSTPEDAAELIRLAGEYPILFFDRVPSFDPVTASLPSGCAAALIRVSQEALWRTQGSMAGLWLTRHFAEADVSGDGQIRYTALVGGDESDETAALVQSCIEEAHRVLTAAGFPALLPADSSAAGAYLHADGFTEASDAGHSLMSAELSRSSAGGQPAELVLCDSPDTALGALTALQAAWYNLGGGDGAGTVPLFCNGRSAGVQAAVSLGQITGAAAPDADGYARAIRGVSEALGAGSSLQQALAAAAEDGSGFSLPQPGDTEGAGLPVLELSPVSLQAFSGSGF